MKLIKIAADHQSSAAIFISVVPDLFDNRELLCGVNRTGMQV